MTGNIIISKLLIHNLRSQISQKVQFSTQTITLAAVTSKDDKTGAIPKNPLSNVHSASLQKENGAIYDKKPFKMICEEGKKYSWCLCGKSKSQPLCDGTHKNIHLKIKFRPVRFEVPETKEYWLCNCKHTSNRPFCDGTHKQEHIQQAIK